MPAETPASLAFLTSGAAEAFGGGDFVVTVRTAAEFALWLGDRTPGLQAIQVEGLLGDPEVWALAAQGTGEIPLDVVVENPSADFATLYRLVDVRMVRPVRVTLLCRPGFLKALRLAVALQIPVRLLPGQPDGSVLSELQHALQFYLRDPMVEVSIEFFHSVLATFTGQSEGTLWSFLEQDPAVFSQRDATGSEILAPDFVDAHLSHLVETGAECASCRWRPLCAGYFKWPDPAYDCAGVKPLLASIESAAGEITRELATREIPALP